MSKKKWLYFIKGDFDKFIEEKKREKEKEKIKERKKGKWFWTAILLLFIFLVGFVGGLYFQGEIGSFSNLFPVKNKQVKPLPSSNLQAKYIPQTTQEAAIIKAVKEISPAVVSIIISKDVPIYKKYYENGSPFGDFEKFFGPDFFAPFNIKVPKYKKEGEKKQKIGSGTGFIISKDGLILTNKHVVYDKSAQYTVVTNNGRQYPAKVLARDPFQDLAIIKIVGKKGEILPDFPTAKLGNSDSVQIGQTAIAIGNALGEFRNTVSVGVISGLGRRITASGIGMVETLEDVIQTDAAINPGNSGGPLLNLKGEVIGVDVAMAQGAQSIGFAVPINKAKRDVAQFNKSGKIIYPFLGLRYTLVTPELKEEKKLSVDYGALVVRGSGKNEPAIMPGSQAEKAGIKEGDIILEVNGGKITPLNSLSKIIQKHMPGDLVRMKILRNGKIITKTVKLGSKSSQ